MSGPMRGPQVSYNFSIPYSGTLAYGDCVLLIGYFQGSVGINIIATYSSTAQVWNTESGIQVSTDTENHILHIQSGVIDEDAKAAFIPGPNH